MVESSVVRQSAPPEAVQREAESKEALQGRNQQLQARVGTSVLLRLLPVMCWTLNSSLLLAASSVRSLM